ncbi:MAG: hypothetical protein QNJ97_03820 [Myxococcota bacterium]|nr:hypothetical protein [Myxococcota bacterium]
MVARIFYFLIFVISAAIFPTVCTPTGDEPALVMLPLTSRGTGLEPCITDLGWRVQVSTFRLAVRDFEFTIEGETHAKRWLPIKRLLVPEAMAHPGHDGGGDVTGELLGDFLLDLVGSNGQSLGNAALLEGDYHGANLAFRSAGLMDGLNSDDPIFGHTAYLAGTAQKNDLLLAFTAVIDVSPDTQMVGGLFNLKVREDTVATLVFEVLTTDPAEGDTLFDGIDFSALDADGDGAASIVPGQAAHNMLMKTLIRHDHYQIAVQ